VRVTVDDIRAKKSTQPIVMVTAYDFPTARIVDEGGVDIILVGDTLAEVVLGYQETLAATMDTMVHHVGAVARARPRALVVGDLPWMSFHVSVPETVVNAARLIRAGADVVKLEGGKKRLPMVRAILDAEIPVMGHLGLTPQSVHVTGGYKVQGKTENAIHTLIDDAKALANEGCFALVLECIPEPVAKTITNSIAIPTIGIGSGSGCDGQVLVFHDLTGYGEDLSTKYVRRYASLKGEAVAAVGRYAADVRERRFPTKNEAYRLPKGITLPDLAPGGRTRQ